MRKNKFKISVVVVTALCCVLLLSMASASNSKEEFFCQNSTVVLTNTIYNNYLSISDTNLNFFTNQVCGATQYEWSIYGFTIATTSTPNLNLDAVDFTTILPIGGCDAYNNNITNGVLASNLSVKANAGTGNTYTIPVYVSGVSECSWHNPWPSLPKGGTGGPDTPYGGIGGE